ncbi:MAG: hypothetical protein M1836_001666 [Candelina mexicana]|nr:MAG: hypothetical protein M1836_001666 [Candelina mexicana]
MVSRWIFEVATTLPLLLDSVTAATLNGYYDASIAAIHHPLSIRTLGSLLPPLNPHPDSLIGLPTELPTCKLELSNDLALHEDCIYAWDMMEEQDSSLLTIYMGNFIIIGMDGGSSAALGFDSLGVPRVYWHKPDTMDGIPFAFNSDVAHKNAIKITVAGIINKCVRLGYGGQNQAGQERRLSVVVQPVSKLSGPALLAINRARASGFDGARMHLNVDDLEQSTIEVVKPAAIQPVVTESSVGWIQRAAAEFAIFFGVLLSRAQVAYGMKMGRA